MHFLSFRNKNYFDLPKLRLLILEFLTTEKHEVSNEVSVERRPVKFSKFRAKMNYCVWFHKTYQNRDSKTSVGLRDALDMYQKINWLEIY
jgi:hypothetical protein